MILGRHRILTRLVWGLGHRILVGQVLRLGYRILVGQILRLGPGVLVGQILRLRSRARIGLIGHRRPGILKGLALVCAGKTVLTGILRHSVRLRLRQSIRSMLRILILIPIIHGYPPYFYR